MTSKSSYTPILHLSSSYITSIKGLSMSNVSPPKGVYMTKTAWSLSLDIKAADRGLDL